MNKTEKKILKKIFGDYNYSKMIATPSELGGSTKGSLKTFENNIAIIMDYIQLLVSGKTRASKEGSGPLGDSYFIDTNSECIYKTGKVKRHFFVNNVPTGNIQFLTGRTNKEYGNSDGMKGLIGSIIEDITKLNPEKIMKSFGDNTQPECVPYTGVIIDSNGDKFKETRYIASNEIDDIPAFSDASKDNNLNCNPNFQKSNPGNNLFPCCIKKNTKESENYTNLDDIICKETFLTKSGNQTPFLYHKNKKRVKMFIHLVVIFLSFALLINL